MRDLFALMVATCCCGGAAHAEIVSFQDGDGGAYSGMAGTTINNDTDIVFGTHFLLTIRTDDMQGLVHFPGIIGNEPGQIPPGSTIHSATLTVTMYNVQEEPAESSIHEVYVGWDEGTFGLSFYGQPGPHYGPAVGTIPVNDPAEETSGDVTSIVQHWADGDANRGIMIRNDVAPAAGAFTLTHYYSDDAQDPSWRPKLIVEFTAPNVAVEPLTWGKIKALYR
jgi:hypothetical protein